MFRQPPRSTRTDPLFPYTTLFRSCRNVCLLRYAGASAADPIGVFFQETGQVRRQIGLFAKGWLEANISAGHVIAKRGAFCAIDGGFTRNGILLNPFKRSSTYGPSHRTSYPGFHRREMQRAENRD